MAARTIFAGRALQIADACIVRGVRVAASVRRRVQIPALDRRCRCTTDAGKTQGTTDEPMFDAHGVRIPESATKSLIVSESPR